eukprot:3806666-Amphidinium_carterae.1
MWSLHQQPGRRARNGSLIRGLCSVHNPKPVSRITLRGVHMNNSRAVGFGGAFVSTFSNGEIAE